MKVVVDTSALAAIVLGEPDAEAMLAAMTRAVGELGVSAATLVEAGIVIEARQGPAATADLHLLLDRLQVETIPLEQAQARLAVAAWHRFGKGRHPAGLNLGDCFAYAAAKHAGAQLLFKGNDFPQTDIPAAL